MGHDSAKLTRPRENSLLDLRAAEQRQIEGHEDSSITGGEWGTPQHTHPVAYRALPILAPKLSPFWVCIRIHMFRVEKTNAELQKQRRLGKLIRPHKSMLPRAGFEVGATCQKE